MSMDRAGRFKQSTAFLHCGELFGNFDVLVCDRDITHAAKAVPFACHLRICPDCERRRSAELVAKYTPLLKDISEKDDRPGWSLKKLMVSTHYSLESDNAVEEYALAWQSLEAYFQLLFQWLLQRELSDAEKRRGRIDYSKHGLAMLVMAEYGGEGHKLHFHITGYFPWIDKHKSSELWQQATGGAGLITYIQKIDYHDVDDALREQIKYVTKFDELPPALAVKLLDVLDGKRRMRSYGIIRDAEKPESEAHICSICGSTVRIIFVRRYFERCKELNVAAEADIVAAAAAISLDLIPGNKAGEKWSHLARSDPPAAPTAQNMPLFDDVFTAKKPVRYD